MGTVAHACVSNGHVRRGFTLIAVMIVVSSALLLATGLLFMVQAEVAGSVSTASSARSQALGQSGVKILIHQLNRQRDRILVGEVPELDEQYEIYETGRRLGVVRLLPVTHAGDRLAPEAGRLDLNRVTGEQLERTGLVDPEVAARIVQYRDQTNGGGETNNDAGAADAPPARPFRSVAELLRVPGVTPEMLYGPLDEITVMDDARADEADLVERIEARLGVREPRGLADVLTVFAHEPPLQHDGTLRINLNVPWSSELGERLNDRFGEGSAAIVRDIMDGGTAFEDDIVVFQVLISFNVPPQEWAEIVDALRTTKEDYQFGRLDINTASEAALAALPGIEPDQAAEIVRAREGLTDDERWTVAWPAMRGILEPEQYLELGHWLTTRSWCYRLRLAVGEVDADEPEGPLENPVIYEVVIDLADPVPRLAELRDITMLQTVGSLLTHAALGEAGRPAWAAGSDDAWGDEQWDTWEPAGAGEVAGLDDLGFDDPASAADFPADAMPPDAGNWPEDDPLAEDEQESPSPNAATGSRRIGRWRP